ncbi:MAG TPA: hypothetical protein VK184_11425 [Nostocaceae cyanobacterium]|nr:hypothetical protein [Nostocaceae cyanobacterium]
MIIYKRHLIKYKNYDLVSKKISNNELGEYLPSEEAELYEQSEEIGASSEPEAKEKCKETAAEYGGIDPKVTPTDREGRWDCKFKFWG